MESMPKFSTLEEYPNIALSHGAERGTLTRLGSSLNFDPTTCPPESMVSATKLRNLEPRHHDCPTLFIVGARKGGTTSLYNYISQSYS